MANVIGEAFVRIRPVTAGFQAAATAEVVPAASAAGTEAGVAAGEGMAKGLATKRSAIGGIIKGFLAAEAIIKGAEFFKGGVEVAAQFQEANRALEVSLKAVGNAGEDTRGRIDTYLAKLQETSAFSRLELTQSFTRLVQGTGSVAKAFQFAGLAADVSRGRHIGLMQATQLVGRVAAGLGVQSLRRLGIAYAGVTTETDKVKAAIAADQKVVDSSSGSTKKAAEAAVKHEKSLLAVAKAHDKVASAAGAVALLQKRFAGQAEDYAHTQEGAIDRVKNSFQLLQKEIGDALVPVITRVADVLDGFAQSLQDANSPARIITETLGTFGGILIAVAVAAKAAAAAEWLFNEAVKANPVVRFITILALLISVFIELYKHNARFRAIVQETWAAIAPIVQAAIARIQAVIAAFIAWANAFWAAHGAQIKRVADQAWHAVQTAFNFIRTYIPVVLNVVRAAVAAFVGAVTAFWGRWGTTLTTIARQAWNLIRTVIQSGMAEVRAIIQAVSDAIHGRWQAFGRDLVNIATTMISGTIRVIRAAIPLAGTAALAIGRAIISNIQSALADLFSVVLTILQQVPHAVEAIVPAVISAAVSIGEGVATGIISGLAGLAGKIGGAISGAVSSGISAAKKAAGIGSPSKVTRDEIGVPLGEGIVRGLDATKPKVAFALTSSVKDAIAQARQALSGIAGTMEGQINDVLDAMHSHSAASVRLASIQARQALQDFQSQQAQLQAIIQGGAAADAAKTVRDAQQQLIQGQITGAQFAAINAQAQIDSAKAVADAKAQLDLLQAQHAVDVEQAATDAKKRLVDQQIDDITNAYNRGVITQQQYLARIAAALKTAGVSYKTAGQALGSAFADGFRDSIQDLVRQVRLLAPFLKGGVVGRGAGSGTATQVADPLQNVRDQLAADQKKARAERTTIAKDNLAITADEKRLAADRKKGDKAAVARDEEQLRLAREKAAHDRAMLKANQAMIRLLEQILRAAAANPNAVDQALLAIGGAAGGTR